MRVFLAAILAACGGSFTAHVTTTPDADGGTSTVSGVHGSLDCAMSGAGTVTAIF